MIAEELIRVLVSVIIAAFSAWWGARLGVRQALDQRRRERAFERALDWAEKLDRLLARVEHLVDVPGMPVTIPAEHYRELWPKLGRVRFMLIRQMRRGVLYVRGDRFRQLEPAVYSIATELDLLAFQMNDLGHIEGRQWLAVMNQIGKTRILLTEFVREELKVE